MPKGSLKLTNARKEEIINACELLYKTMSFKEITMKDIASATSFTRTSIYNYFETKEEIFLALLKREYELWVASLNKLICEHSELSLDEVASLLARSLAERKQLLKLLSMNHYDMEQNSREEKLVEMKTAYGNSMKTVNLYLQKFCRGMSEKDRENFIYIFFPFMFGAYPYAVVTDKQKEAMKQAQVEYSYLSVYEILYNCIKTLLG
ncbi:MAG: TetR/AcrR family transcriptional regulator [Ruminococcaceae bacterium]|nr:TetR/AcrR family transcriptional regulator [Oscillospiraceae bacterium]